MRRLNGSQKESSRSRRALALGLYTLGLLLLVAIAGIAIGPELEVMLFDPPLITEQKLTTLRCPLAITTHEIGRFSATFRNNQERDLSFVARARISYQSVLLVEEIGREVELAPGERETVSWPLDPDRAVYGRMILARVHVPRRGSAPPQQAGCGVLVMNLPLFTGTQYIVGMVLGGLLSLAASATLWLDGRRPAEGWQDKNVRRLALLAAVVAGATLASLFNLWAVAGLLVLIAILLLLSFAQ